MYKDKPYNYPDGRRRGRKRTVLAVVWGLVMGYLWWTGWFTFGMGRDDPERREGAGQGLWGMFESKGGGKSVSWMARREQVKKAMEISWGGYEKYAWGMFFSFLHPLTLIEAWRRVC
jgi:hypothetical protein